MYPSLIFLHSIFRWLVLISLLATVIRAARGYYGNLVFSKVDNSVRHTTATIAHIQLVLGMVLYFQSPVVQYFFKKPSGNADTFDATFFGLIHNSMMLISILIITFGSALARRKSGDKEKHQTLLVWYTIALLIILVAIPWPFSPFANRPYLR